MLAALQASLARIPGWGKRQAPQGRQASDCSTWTASPLRLHAASGPDNERHTCLAIISYPSSIVVRSAPDRVSYLRGAQGLLLIVQGVLSAALDGVCRKAVWGQSAGRPHGQRELGFGTEQLVAALSQRNGKCSRLSEARCQMSGNDTINGSQLEQALHPAAEARRPTKRHTAMSTPCRLTHSRSQACAETSPGDRWCQSYPAGRHAVWGWGGQAHSGPA